MALVDARPRSPARRRPARPRVAPRLPRTLAVLLPLFIFCAFLTQTKFIPGLRNNVGPFELVALLVIPAFFLYYRKPGIRLRSHPVIGVIAAMVAAAAASQLVLPASHRVMGLVQTVILAFLLVFLIALYNLVLQYGLEPSRLLRWITWAILIVGPWVVFSGFQAEGDIQAAGPFRNRAHMASYMLTAFWLVLLFALWPKLKARDRWVSHGALVLTLYAVAVSGRRSVYLALLLGFAGLAVGWLAADRGRRLVMLRSAGVAGAFLVLFYTFGALFVPQAEFFQERVGMIGHRLEQALASEEEASAGEDSFFVLQRQGVEQAFRERPILGIGWGGFAKSRYSPTGHEVHSTPLRFLAELGLVGFLLYLALMTLLLLGSLRLFWRMRRTPYSATYLTLMMALWSLSVSYIYNRHVTERTFWLLLLVFLVLEAFAAAYHRAFRRRADDLGATATPRRAGRTRPSDGG